MRLSKEDIELIKPHMAERLAEQSRGQATLVYEIELRERDVRVEQELKPQRDQNTSRRVSTAPRPPLGASMLDWLPVARQAFFPQGGLVRERAYSAKRRIRFNAMPDPADR